MHACLCSGPACRPACLPAGLPDCPPASLPVARYTLALAPRPRPAGLPPLQLRLSGAQLEEKREAEGAVQDLQEQLELEGDEGKRAELAAELAARRESWMR